MSFPSEEISPEFCSFSTSSSSSSVFQQYFQNPHDAQILLSTATHLTHRLKQLQQKLGDEASWDQLLNQKFVSRSNERRLFQVLDDLELLSALIDVDRVSKMTSLVQNQVKAVSSAASSQSTGRKSNANAVTLNRLAKTRDKLQHLTTILNQKMKLMEPIIENKFFSTFQNREEEQISTGTNQLIKALNVQLEALEKRSHENEKAMMDAVAGLKARIIN